MLPSKRLEMPAVIFLCRSLIARIFTQKRTKLELMKNNSSADVGAKDRPEKKFSDMFDSKRRDSGSWTDYDRKKTTIASESLNGARSLRPPTHPRVTVFTRRPINI